MKITKLNMINWIFYYHLLLQMYIASILVIYKIDNHYVINRVSDSARLLGWFSIQYTMIMLPLSMVLVSRFLKKSSNYDLFNYYIEAKIDITNSMNKYLRIPLYLISIICISAIFYTYVHLNPIPIIEMIHGAGSHELAQIRIDVSRNFQGNEYLKNTFGIVLTPFIAYVSFVYWKASRKQIDFLWFIIMFIASFFILTYSLAKAPFIMFLIGFIFIYVLVDGQIKLKKLVIFGILSSTLLLVSYAFIARVDDLLSLFSYNTGIGGRILLSQSAGTFYAFDIFPRLHDHLWFSSTSGLINSIFGIQTQDRAARILMTFFNPGGVKEGVAGVMNSLFIEEAWANFGWIGLLLSPVYVGAFVQILFIGFLHFKKSPIAIGALSYIAIKLPINGGFNDFYYNVSLVIIFIAILFSLILGRSIIFNDKLEKRSDKHNENDISPSITD